MVSNEQGRQHEDKAAKSLEWSQLFVDESAALAENDESVFSEGWAGEDLDEVQSMTECPDPDADFAEDLEMNDSEPSQTSDSGALEPPPAAHVMGNWAEYGYVDNLKEEFLNSGGVARGAQEPETLRSRGVYEWAPRDMATSRGCPIIRSKWLQHDT